MSTLFTHARILNGRGDLIEDGWVLVDGDRIRAVDRSEVGPPDMPAGRITDLGGKTLLAGFTTVRDLGCLRHVGLHVRDAVRDGMIPGPRMCCAGQMICMTGGHGWQIGMEADGADAVRRAARLQLRAGADVIKVMATGGICTEGVEPANAQLTLEELSAAVEEAHKAGCRAAAHAQGLGGVKNALRAGIDSIEHGVQLDEEAIEIMLKNEVYLVPTISAGAHMIARGIEAGIPAFMVEKSRAHRETRLDSLARARHAGVRIAFGTDAGTPFNAHGNNAFELQELVRVGFSTSEAIVAATSTAAELLGVGDRIGTLAPGFLADIVVVDGDPLSDVGVLASSDNIVSVYQSGSPVPNQGDSRRMMPGGASWRPTSFVGESRP